MESSEASCAKNALQCGLTPGLRTPCPGRNPGDTARVGSAGSGTKTPQAASSPPPPVLPVLHRAVPNPPFPRWGCVSKSYLWNSRFVKPLTLGPRPTCAPESPCQRVLKCNPGTLSEPLFYKKGTYHNSWTSPFRLPLRASSGPGCSPAAPQPLPCMLLGSPFVSDDFSVLGLRLPLQLF